VILASYFTEVRSAIFAAPLCSYPVTPSSLPVGAGGGSASVDVSTPGGCLWTASSQSGFVTITSGASFSGSGTITVNIQENTGASRSGNLLVAGQTVVVTQGAAGPPPEPTDTELSYFHTDAIGSARAITDVAGTIVRRYDYLPDGQEIVNEGSGTPWNRVRFGGKERDVETGYGSTWLPLDYFGARYYQQQLGRFTSVDPVFTWEENLVDPQRWNRYSYANNNPLRYVDPDGRAFMPARDTSIAAGLRRQVRSALGDGFLAGVADALIAPFAPVTPQEMGDSLIAAAFPIPIRAASAAATASVRAGTKVFRVWGDGAGPWGTSWTTVDPRSVSNYSNAAGLPRQNTARFLSEGTLQTTNGVRTRASLPLRGNAGGLPEVVIPNPSQQIKLQNVQGLNKRR
jgi:RHS repeat-associated protein